MPLLLRRLVWTRKKNRSTLLRFFLSWNCLPNTAIQVHFVPFAYPIHDFWSSSANRLVNISIIVTTIQIIGTIVNIFKRDCINVAPSSIPRPILAKARITQKTSLKTGLLNIKSCASDTIQMIQSLNNFRIFGFCT